MCPFVSRRPSLAAALDGREWQRDVAEVLVPLHERLVPYLPELRSAWTHGDGHASNLFWTSRGEVAAVIDFVSSAVMGRDSTLIIAGFELTTLVSLVSGRSPE